MEELASTLPLDEFWYQGQFLSFIGKNEKRIAYAEFVHINANKNLIIVPGRCEGYLKYQELAYELFQQDVNVYLIDHRGQGLSERLTNNPHKGYVENFDDYSDDLTYFIKEIVNKNHPELKSFVIAHSMGSAITLRLLQRENDVIQAAVLCSPMIGINRGKLPLWLAKVIVNTGNWINTLFSKTPWYFFGQGDYDPPCFAKNKLTHDSERYQSFMKLYQQESKLQLGGVTFHWLAQALQTNKAIFDDLNKITAPLLVLQASADEIVDNAEQDKFCQLLHQLKPKICQQSQPITFEGAYHELFFEQDRFRTPAIKTSLEWLNKQRST